MERIDWQTQQSTTGERGTDTHKKHDNKLLWLYHRHQYQHHYYIQQISIPGAWGILEIFVILRYLRLYLLIIPFIFHGCILFTRLPKMHLKHHKEAGQHVVWYVGAWFGWKDNTYWPPKSREFGAKAVEFGAKAVQWFIDGAVKSTVSLIWLALPICCVCASTFAFNTHLNLLLDLQQCYFSWKRQATNFCRYSGLEILVGVYCYLQSRWKCGEIELWILLEDAWASFLFCANYLTLGPE